MHGKLRPRVIPCLLLQGDGFVKTTRFKNPRYVGDPINTLKIFNDKCVDELMILDISCSRKNTPINFKLIEELASECFMPLAYGGGIQSVDDAKKLIAMGIEKIVVGSAAYARPELISDLANVLGSQAIIASVDVKSTFFSGLAAYSHGGQQKQPIDPLKHTLSLCSAGAGEILLTDIDKDGTLHGYNLELIKKFTCEISVPVIASGGAKNFADLQQVIFEGGAAAAAAGSLFVFQKGHLGVLMSYPERSFLKSLRFPESKI